MAVKHDADLQPLLEGERVCLRPLQEEDCYQLHVVSNDERISAMVPRIIPMPFTLERARERIDTAHTDWKAKSAAFYAIWRTENPLLVGCIALNRIHQHDEAGGLTANLGGWIGLEHWGKGYATMAGELIIEFGFRAADRGGLGLQRITACHYGPNTASGQVLQKLGFVHLRSDASPGYAEEEYETSDFYELQAP